MSGESPSQALAALAAAPEDLLPATRGSAPVARLPGARKAAVLMAAIGSERAAAVMQRLGDDEIESVSMEMMRLNAVAAETTDSVFSELAASTSAGAPVAGGIELAREVIERALGPERAMELLGRLSAGTEVRTPSSSCAACPRRASQRCWKASRRRPPRS